MSKVKRYFLVLSILCIALIPCTSVFVSAAEYDYIVEYSFEEPCTDEWTGYLVQPRYTYGYSSITWDCIFWKITPILTGSETSVPSVAYNYYAGDRVELIFGTGVDDVAYSLSVFRALDMSVSGTFVPVYTGLISYDDSYTFTLDLTSRYDQFARPKMKNVQVFDTTYPSSGPNYAVVWSDTSVLYRELIETNDKLTYLINGLDLTNEQLTDLYTLLNDYLKKIYQNTDSMTAILDQLYYDFYYWTWTVDEHHERIIQLLEQLIEGTEEFTESSTLSDEQNELNRVEDELLNNEDASNAQNDIKVEVNENALAFIWDLISQFLNSNPKLFGIFISVLSLGIIALILNR